MHDTPPALPRRRGVVFSPRITAGSHPSAAAASYTRLCSHNATAPLKFRAPCTPFHATVRSSQFAVRTQYVRSTQCSSGSQYVVRSLYRESLYIISMSSSYIGSASPLPERISAVAQCLRWFRISSRPTARSASCTDEICVMMSAQ